ncbi:MAG: hypothetical protein K2L57_05670, partial [Muribaculaceae bacterium]|nr:hypothetical protein [Muribaculaceae bacterium]
MLHHNYGVADALKPAENAYQFLGVARVKPDARLVEYVERAYERAAERCGEVDSLALAARKGGGEAVEREIGESDFVEKPQPLADLGEKPCRYDPVCLSQLQISEEFRKFAQRHLDEVG